MITAPVKPKKTRKPRLNCERLSIAHWKRLGYQVDSVERFIATGGGKGFKRDCFSFADLLAYKPDTPGSVTLLQVTSESHHHSRCYKVLASEHAWNLAKLGIRIGVQSWRDDGSEYAFKWITVEMWSRVLAELIPVGLKTEWRVQKRKIERKRKAVAAEKPVELFG